MSLADKLRNKSRIHKTTLRGERIGIRMLTRNEMRDHVEKIQAAQDDERSVFDVFASYVLDENGEQAFTVDEMEDVLTNAELSDLIKEFNKANGVQSEDESEKN